MPRLYLTECGVVLFLHLGLAEFKNSLCDAWQAAVELLDGRMITGTLARPIGEAPDLLCANQLAAQLWDQSRAA
ncbi:hypothetical protein [Gloeobacter kilaueensis]|nr:hypothetical protein [Gloeobacter kilaueensis]